MAAVSKGARPCRRAQRARLQYKQRDAPYPHDIHEAAAAARASVRLFLRCGQPGAHHPTATPLPDSDAAADFDARRHPYRLQAPLAGGSLRWRSRIVRWEPPIGFVDGQLHGPYRLWRHTHRFHDGGDTTIIEDTVRYRLPFAPFGEIFHPVVRLQLKGIFRFRQSAVRSCLLAEPGLCDSGAQHTRKHEPGGTALPRPADRGRP